MKNLEKLYDAFGELIYVVAMSDGLIQEEEYEALEKVLSKHSWAKEVKWSFDYERKNKSSIDELYKKVIDICYAYGPRKEYHYLLEILTEVAKSSDGIDKQEEEIINNFTLELTERFKKDLENI